MPPKSLRVLKSLRKRLKRDHKNQAAEPVKRATAEYLALVEQVIESENEASERGGAAGPAGTSSSIAEPGHGAAGSSQPVNFVLSGLFEKRASKETSDAMAEFDKLVGRLSLADQKQLAALREQAATADRQASDAARCAQSCGCQPDQLRKLQQFARDAGEAAEAVGRATKLDEARRQKVRAEKAASSAKAELKRLLA